MTATAHVKTFLSCGHRLEARVLRLKLEVQILGSSKSIRHTKVEILRLESCFLRKKETKLNANLRKAFSTELFSPRLWWFHVVLANDLHLARKPRPDPVLRGQPCRSWIKNVWCLSSLPSIITTRIPRRVVVPLLIPLIADSNRSDNEDSRLFSSSWQHHGCNTLQILNWRRWEQL